MAHLVLGYPTLQESLRTAEKYIAAGVAILELQIPFSHPTADGPVITVACQAATQQGISVRDCLEVIRELRQRFPNQEIMVMSYLNRIYTFGFQAFITKMEALGIKHLIIPDLPVDASKSFMVHSSSLKLVPVLAANTPDERVDHLLNSGFDFFYLMSDFKITGSGYSLHPNLKAIIDKIKSHIPKPAHHQSPIPQSPVNQSPITNHPKPRIGIGFGISTPEQARLVAAEADVAIIGSALIQAQNAGKLEEYLESLQRAFHND